LFAAGTSGGGGHTAGGHTSHSGGDVWDVVVVGAGIAGLAAARVLLNEAAGGPPLRVTVLEGGDRVGGRVLDVVEGGDDTAPICLGATWLHSSVGNPLYDWAESSGLLDGAGHTTSFTAVARPADVAAKPG